MTNNNDDFLSPISTHSNQTNRSAGSYSTTNVGMQEFQLRGLLTAVNTTIQTEMQRMMEDLGGEKRQLENENRAFKQRNQNLNNENEDLRRRLEEVKSSILNARNEMVEGVVELANKLREMELPLGDE